MTDPMRRLAPVVRLAPAKLNLTLAVVGRRPDGFHDLHSVMVTLDIADRLSLAPSDAGSDSLHVVGHDTGPAETNAVLRAIAAARTAAGPVGDPVPGPGPHLAARLEKAIPVAAGLAGGSSDAAAALDGALEAWGVDLPAGLRSEVAASLGSDVPFFLAGGMALVEGRGERVTSLPPIGHPRPAILLVVPSASVSTAAVYAAFAAGHRPHALGSARAASEHLVAELGRGMRGPALVDRAGVLAAANDLVPATAAVVPDLVPFRRALFRLVGRPIGQSGSGPALWSLYPSLDSAAAAAVDVRAALEDGRLTPPGGAATVLATTLTGGESG